MAENATVTQSSEQTTVDNANTNSQQASTQSDTTDYKALYETMKADRDKLKGLNDKYSSELSGYKKEKAATMTESERLTEELETQRQTTTELQQRIARIQSEKVFADRGYKPEEYNPIIETIELFGTVTEDNSVKLSETITDIIGKRVAQEKQLYENSMTANNTVQSQTNTNTNSVNDVFSQFREADKKLRETQNKKLNI